MGGSRRLGIFQLVDRGYIVIEECQIGELPEILGGWSAGIWSR